MLSAVDGNRGVELARTCLPDVILMDINLPGISGIQALKILLNDASTAHIPALSAQRHASRHREGEESGVFRYLTKPIKVSDFMDALNEALAFAEKPGPSRARSPDCTSSTTTP
jgi:CheY-like chemotaxis protein